MKEEWITSESMGNYSKIYQRITSGVKTSKILIEWTEKKYEILIQDNGKGFTMEEVEDKANSHFGLALIHEGVNLLNGTIHVSSAIGRGTMIDIKIPLDLHSALKKNS